MATLISPATTKAAFVSQVMRELKARRLNKMSGPDRLSAVLRRIQAVRAYEVVSHHQAMTAYAVEWSVNTSRLNLEPELAMNAMNTRQIVGLIYDLSKTCPTIGDVPYRLNAMYRPVPVVAQEVEQEQPESLTPAQERVMDRLSAGETLCTVEKAGKVVEAHLYSEATGVTRVSKIVAIALLAKKRVCRYCWYETTDGQHVEYVAA